MDRYPTIPLCMIQAIFLLVWMQSQNGGSPLVHAVFQQVCAAFWLMGVLSLTAGCVFLMWLGEQIDEYGLGNGVSLIILAGIVARMPQAIGLWSSRPASAATGAVSIRSHRQNCLPGGLLYLRGRRLDPDHPGAAADSDSAGQAHARPAVYGGQKQYLPLRVNHGGVMPIIFAQSLMLFPGLLFRLAMLQGSI